MPFITREMKHLKLVKNIELKKNKSTSNIVNNKIENFKLNLKRRKFCKIYRYYFSKNKISEKLMNQQINKMRKELKEKQEKETNEFNDIFHKNYPPESETEYNNEINTILSKENLEKSNYDKIKKNFLEKKHEEYINKMGVEFEKKFKILNQKFQKEKEEQNATVKRIILNYQIKEMEKNNINNNGTNKNNNNLDINKKNNQLYFSQYQFYLKGDKENKKEKDDALKNKLCSKIFRFNARGNFYKTIII